MSGTGDGAIIRVVPELCVAATTAGNTAELVCWMLLRHADTMLNDGSGRVRRSTAVHYLSERLALTERRIRQIIISGMGAFWRSGKHDWLYLVGVLRLCDVLDVRGLISRYVLVAHDVIANDFSKTRPLISAMAACMFAYPTAVAYIAKACGVSKRTIQRHLADANDMLIIRRNVLMLHQSREADAAMAARDAIVASHRHPEGSVSIKVANNGTYCVVREMPNTYDFISGRASYGKLRYRLKRRRGIVEKSGHGDKSDRPMAAYNKLGIMNLMDISGWQGRATELTEVWKQDAT